MAIWSLILSIVLGALGALAAIPMGFVARKQIRRSNGSQTGSGLALAGIIVSFVWLGLIVLIIVVPLALGSPSSSGPSLSDLNSSVQSQITSSGSDGFGATSVASVVCNPPSSWQPGATFTCYAYDNSNTEVGEYDGTVEPNDGSGNYRWNANWIPGSG
jgi:ABC-type dipeptide/oligopeptide/nickel transport system permease component